MTDKHDFKGIIEDFRDTGDTVTIIRNSEADEVIQTALRLADRLQSGEVSDEMRLLGNKACNFHPEDSINIKYAFKAMAAQMIKEEENDK